MIAMFILQQFTIHFLRKCVNTVVIAFVIYNLHC